MGWLMNAFLTEDQQVRLGDWIRHTFPPVEKLAQRLTHLLEKEHEGRVRDCSLCSKLGWR